MCSLIEKRNQIELSNQVMNHPTMDIRKTEITTSVAINQFLVVQTQLMQNGGMQIVYIHRVLHGLVTKVIGRTMHHTLSNATAS